MALFAKHNETKFGVGDTVRVTQTVVENEKKRNYSFEGMVIGIKGRDQGKTFTVRRVGEAKVGIERIFPLHSTIIQSIEVVKPGHKGVRRSKLYYSRDKSRKEIDLISSRFTRKASKKAKSK